MAEWIKEIIIAFGGGATATVSTLLVFKYIFKKVIDKAIDTSFEKSAIKLTNRLNRTTKAYEIILKKEFEFYEKIDPDLAVLVPLIQDLEYYATTDIEENNKETKEDYKEHLLKYLDIIPRIKNDAIMYRPYISEKVFNAVTVLVKNMQDDIEYLTGVAETLYCISENKLDLTRVKEIKERVLISVAFVETEMKIRLTELSKE